MEKLDPARQIAARHQTALETLLYALVPTGLILGSDLLRQYILRHPNSLHLVVGATGCYLVSIGGYFLGKFSIKRRQREIDQKAEK